jgi:hypothetical protein
MPEPLRIFIGSSSEAREKAEILQELLYEQGPEIQPNGWWSEGAFAVGSTFLESLRSMMKATDAALLLATEDDKTVTRGKEVLTPRDNILFEYGMSIEAHGPERTALVVLGNPKLPTDLSGVTHLFLEPGANRGDFKERNRGRIRGLVDQWRSSFRNRAQAPTKQPSTDSEDALALVNELLKYRDDLLSNTNLVQRYQINRIVIPKLCEKMNASVARVSGSSLGQVIMLEAYMEFERKRRWQWKAGYRHHTDLTPVDGTEAISGVSEREREELKKAAGVDPRRVSPSAHEAVRGVSWYDAAVYCMFARGRLPTKEELTKLPSSEHVKDLWEWSQSWFSEGEAHIAVVRRSRQQDPTEFIGVNPDLRLPKIGFRVIR